MNYSKYHAKFEAWFSAKYPHGTYYFGMSCTDRDRYEKFTNGEYRDTRLQAPFVAFIAGYELGEQDGETNTRE